MDNWDFTRLGSKINFGRICYVAQHPRLGPHRTHLIDVFNSYHYKEVIMSAMASQITSLTIVYSTVYSRKHWSSASLAFVRGIRRWPVNSRHKGLITWKIFLCDSVIMVLFTRTQCIIRYGNNNCQISKVHYIANTTTHLTSHDTVTWWRHQMKTFSALFAICAGNSQFTGEFSAQRLVTRSCDVFFDMCLH